MKLEEIKVIAKRHNIGVGKLKKAELVQAIQRSEGNEACFATGVESKCGQHRCLWREDCF